MRLACVLLFSFAASAQRMEPGHPIGKAAALGDLVVLTLDENALGPQNLFNLQKRTLRFTPDGAGYRIENVPLVWDADFGAEMAGAQASLTNFAFPFSGKTWDSFSTGVTGSIAFGAAGDGGGRAGRGGQPAAGAAGAGRGGRGGGLTADRFAQLGEQARAFVNIQPAICPFFKMRMSGKRYFKETSDRAVVTWDVSEPYGGIQDFSWTPTVNRFQAVLHKDGAIELSYDQLNARDAVVGVYPLVQGGPETTLASVDDKENPAVPAHLDIRGVKLSAVNGIFLKVAFQTRGAVPAAGDASVAGVTYRATFKTKGHADVVWSIRGLGAMGRGGRGAASRYAAQGPGLSGAVNVDGNTISMEGTAPPELLAGDLTLVAETLAPGPEPGTSKPADAVPAKTVKLAGLHSPDVDFAAVKKTDGPFPIAYESFHYYRLPNFRDMACSVIQSLGDKFDFLAYYSDFRVDNQEAGTPSNGPRGGNVAGIGDPSGRTQDYCSDGRFQWGFIQPVYVGSNQMQEKSPPGVVVDRAGGKPMTGYNLAMSQIGHEMGHRWSAFVRAKVGNETIPLGPTHWARGLQAQVAFPYTRMVEASAMGGGVWQDNFDGTYTQLDDDYFVPATGWSYLDMYLMGLAEASEVPDFFILRNLAPAGRDANGHPIFKADRTKVTVQDVIAVEGVRTPAPDKSQRKFNTGMVMVVEHGKTPSRELVERVSGIREKWMEYFSITTGRRASMTATAK